MPNTVDGSSPCLVVGATLATGTWVGIRVRAIPKAKEQDNQPADRGHEFPQEHLGEEVGPMPIKADRVQEDQERNVVVPNSDHDADKQPKPDEANPAGEDEAEESFKERRLADAQMPSGGILDQRSISLRRGSVGAI